jgi:Bacterial Ig-like domain (group 3)
VLAIVGITVTVASSALPSAVPSSATTTSVTAPSANSSTLSSTDVTHLIGGTSSTTTPTAATTTTPAASTATSTASTASTTTSTASSASNTTDQKVYVEVVSATATSADDVNSVSEADARALVASMNTYWSGESAGAVTITFGGFETSSLNAASCDPASIYAAEPASAFGKQFANNAWQGTGKHLLILTTESCGGDGQGSVGGNGGIMLSGNGTGASLGEPVAFHEFGHNLGFGHAGSAICRSSVTEDGSVTDFGDANSLCPTDEYGDFLDIMGYSVPGAIPHLSTPERIAMGWMTDYTTLTSATATSTTTVTSLDGAAGNRALKIVDPVTQAVYYVEYRTATGTDASSSEFTAAQQCTVNSGYIDCARGVSAATGSVRILRVLPYRNSATSLRTVVVAVGTTDEDNTRTTHFGVGDTFTTTGGVYVTLNSVSPSAGASITVRFSPPAATTTSVALTASTRAYESKSQTTVKASVSAADGSAATGTVTFLDGTKKLGTGTLTGGVASLAVPSTATIGTHKITARYTPATGDTAASTGNVKKLVVTKQKSTIAVKVAKHTATLKFSINGSVVKKGTLRVYVAGHLVKKVTLKKSSATVTLPKSTKKVVVKYAGTKLVAAKTVTKKIAK